jgi:hypothetical protein
MNAGLEQLLDQAMVQGGWRGDDGGVDFRGVFDAGRVDGSGGVRDGSSRRLDRIDNRHDIDVFDFAEQAGVYSSQMASADDGDT